MTYANTESITRHFEAGWSPAGDRFTGARIWRVTSPGKPERWEADVYRAGQQIATLSGPTREDVTDRLVKRFGRGE